MKSKKKITKVDVKKNKRKDLFNVIKVVILLQALIVGLVLIITRI